MYLCLVDEDVETAHLSCTFDSISEDEGYSFFGHSIDKLQIGFVPHRPFIKHNWLKET